MGRRKKRRFNLADKMPEVEGDIRRGINIVIIFLLAILSLLSIFGLAGSFGTFFDSLLRSVFGWGFFIFPIVLIAAGYLALRTSKYSFENINWVGMFLLIIGYSGVLHLTQNPEVYKEILKEGIGGGYVGYGIAVPLYKIMGRWAAMAVSFAVFLIGAMLMFNSTLEDIVGKITLRGFRESISGLFNKEEESEEYDDEEVEFEEREIGEDEEDEEGEGDKDEEDEEEVEEGSKKIIVQKTKRRFPKIDIPLDLLSNKAGKPTSGDIKKNREIIEVTLSNFGIDVEMGEESVGPTVTRYTFKPADGIKLSRIIGLGNNLSLALAAHSIRIEAPIPGKSLVGIEVPNKKTAIVPLRRVLESESFKRRSSNLTLVLGENVAGSAYLTDLAKLPHLLVAGQTGSGKTVCLNSLIVSLLYQNQPDELKLILVDPKRVDMPAYNGIPHLMTPVIEDPKKVLNALKWTISEMNRRFGVLNNAHKKNIQSYNITHSKNKMPYIIFIIDELAQLMSTIGAELEAGIVSLAQMGRAAGIHLILATQRPSVNIITGIIKANISGRISFSVSALTDSRTILDASGAEKLIGRGDMLFKSDQVPSPNRVQGVFCSDDDIEKVVEFLKEKAEPDYQEGVVEKQPTLGLGGVVMKGGLDDEDELFEDARELVIEAGKASASYLQRRLKIGYARAARILDLLEDQGIIGPADGAKPREILIKEGEQSLVEQADNLIAESENMGEELPDEEKLENKGEELEESEEYEETGKGDLDDEELIKKDKEEILNEEEGLEDVEDGENAQNRDEGRENDKYDF